MKQKFLRLIADLRFAIINLLTIATLSIIGTIIEQDQTIEFYKQNYPLNNKIFGFFSWDIIIELGLDHIYKTWWFIAFIFLFGISLLTCTFLQQFPIVRLARKCQLFRKLKQFYFLKLSVNLKNYNLGQIILKIKKKQYSIFHQKNIFYCYKGLIGRLTPIIVHFSIILILLGAIFSAVGGFKTQEVIPETEIFYIQNLLAPGYLSFIPKLALRINDFWITYTKQTTIGQFYSDLSILGLNGNEIKQQTIFVNSPANYEGIDYYQTDWDLIGLRIKDVNSKIFQYPLINFLTNKEKIWITWISTNPQFKNGIIILINSLQGYCSIYNQFGTFLGNLEINENLNISITLIEILSSTGLQIKNDPGLLLIYTGFFILIVSTLISYITYSQIWIIKINDKIFIGGNTSRAKFEFEIELFKIIK